MAGPADVAAPPPVAAPQGFSQPTDDEIDVVQHPTLGPLKFPKTMPPDQRNSLIEEMEKSAPAPQQKPPTLAKPSPEQWSTIAQRAAQAAPGAAVPGEWTPEQGIANMRQEDLVRAARTGQQPGFWRQQGEKWAGIGTDAARMAESMTSPSSIATGLGLVAAPEIVGPALIAHGGYEAIKHAPGAVKGNPEETQAALGGAAEAAGGGAAMAGGPGMLRQMRQPTAEAIARTTLERPISKVKTDRIYGHDPETALVKEKVSTVTQAKARMSEVGQALSDRLNQHANITIDNGAIIRQTAQGFMDDALKHGKPEVAAAVERARNAYLDTNRWGSLDRSPRATADFKTELYQEVKWRGTDDAATTADNFRKQVAANLRDKINATTNDPQVVELNQRYGDLASLRDTLQRQADKVTDKGIIEKAKDTLARQGTRKGAQILGEQYPGLTTRTQQRAAALAGPGMTRPRPGLPPPATPGAPPAAAAIPGGPQGQLPPAPAPQVPGAPAAAVLPEGIPPPAGPAVPMPGNVPGNPAPASTGEIRDMPGTDVTGAGVGRPQLPAAPKEPIAAPPAAAERLANAEQQLTAVKDQIVRQGAQTELLQRAQSLQAEVDRARAEAPPPEAKGAVAPPSAGTRSPQKAGPGMTQAQPIRYETRSNGDRWAIAPDGVKVSIKGQMSQSEIRSALEDQRTKQASVKSPEAVAERAKPKEDDPNVLRDRLAMVSRKLAETKSPAAMRRLIQQGKDLTSRIEKLEGANGKAAPETTQKKTEIAAEPENKAEFWQAPKTEPLEKRFTPEELEDAKLEIDAARHAWEQMPKPERFEVGRGEQSEENPLHPRWHTWMGVSSSRPQIEALHPWLIGMREGVSDLGKALEKGKGAAFERLMAAAAEFIRKNPGRWREAQEKPPF